MILTTLISLTLSSTAAGMPVPPSPPTPPARAAAAQPAAAATPPPPPPPPAPPAAAGAPTPPAPPAPPPPPPFVPQDDDGVSRLQIPWTERSGEGVAFAYDNGSWGGEWSQGIRVQIPFGDHFAASVRGLMVFESAPGFGDVVDIGGRLELVGRSPVMLNVLRLYGGGGVQVFSPIGTERDVTVGGGGHFGFEFFMMPHMSWILEVGGQSGVAEGIAGGATIMAGLQLYPF